MGKSKEDHVQKLNDKHSFCRIGYPTPESGPVPNDIVPPSPPLRSQVFGFFWAIYSISVVGFTIFRDGIATEAKLMAFLVWTVVVVAVGIFVITDIEEDK